MSGDKERLQRLLGSPETAWIVRRLRARLAKGQDLVGAITLSDATEAQRVAVGRLLGRSVSAGRSVSVSLERLDEVLRTSGAWPDGLASAVVVLTGPVDDPDVRQAEREAWQAAADELAAVARDRPQLADWVDELRAHGRLRRVSTGPDEALVLARGLRAVVDALPAGGESLGGFAARVLHRAHALDPGVPLGSMAVSAADVLGKPSSGARYGSAAWRREAWASVGVLVDDLSSTVLVLNLPGGPSSPTAQALANVAASGQPAVLTLRQVVADDLGSAPPVVYVCENPAVVSAAADRLGCRCAPLVCVQGQPGAAAVTLLRRLQERGVCLRFHGDFDWGGVAIGRTLAAHVSWRPWRYGSADYRAALCRRAGPAAGSELEGANELNGTRAETAWDPELAEAMVRNGLRIEEELVLDDLLSDLGSDDHRRPDSQCELNG